MSCPLASVVNPQNPNQVMVFYLSGNQSPGLELHDVGASATTATAFTDNLSAPVDSKIVNPGSFSALNCSGLLNLYGLVQGGPAPNNATATDATAPKRLAQLSPVYKLLLPSSDPTTVIGVAMSTIVDDNGQGFMYSMTGTEAKPIISEFAVGWTSSSKVGDIITKPLTDNPPLVASNLAAAYDPTSKKKYIIYQNKDDLHIVESTSNNDIPIPNTDDSRDSTGLAVIPVATAKGTQLYLYYFAMKGGKLQRVIRNEDGTWQDSATVESLVSDPNTFLTATKVGNIIMVYYIVKNGSTIHSFRDQVKS